MKTKPIPQVVKNRHPITIVQQILSEALTYDKLFVLVDKHTKEFCLPLLKEIGAMAEADIISIPANDNNKGLESLTHIWQQLTRHGATRHSLLINLGGGMVTDIGGFAAATFKRGIQYINIPTTLLGAVDASVGGKTGINFAGFKNEVGAFYHAKHVVISSHFFKTLNREDLLSGFAEMFKHALIDSKTEWEELLRFDAAQVDYDWLNEAVFRSVSIKEKIVEQDPFELNIRKALNFGHTVGHALESLAIDTGRPVLHGYAVAWGMVAELYLSHRLCGFPKELLDKSVQFIHRYYGSFNFSHNDYKLLLQIMLHDKKNRDGIINFTLLSNIGEVRINQNTDQLLIFDALNFLQNIDKL